MTEFNLEGPNKFYLEYLRKKQLEETGSLFKINHSILDKLKSENLKRLHLERYEGMQSEETDSSLIDWVRRQNISIPKVSQTAPEDRRAMLLQSLRRKQHLNAQPSPVNTRTTRKSPHNLRNLNLTESTEKERELLKKLTHPEIYNEKSSHIQESNPPSQIKIPDIKLNIKRGLFENLLSEEKIFVISEGVLYNLGFPAKSGEKRLSYKGLDFVLEQSEEIKDLERIYYGNNKDQIERFKSDLLKTLSDEELNINNALKDIVSQKEYQLAEAEMLDAIVNYRSNSIDELRKQRASNIASERIDFKSISEFNPELSGEGFSKAIKKVESESGRKNLNTLVGVFGNLYAINSRAKSAINLDKLNDFYPINASHFDSEHIKAIEEEITEKTRARISETLSVLSRRKGEVDSIRMPREAASNNSSIKTRRIEDGYIIYRDIPQFIIFKNREHSIFDSARIATIVHFNGNQVKIDYPGFVLDNKNYTHLFSTGTNEYGTTICHGSANGGVSGLKNTWQKIDPTSKFEIANQVHLVLNKLEQILTVGCKGDYVPARASMLVDRRISDDNLRNLRQMNVKIYNND